MSADTVPIDLVPDFITGNDSAPPLDDLACLTCGKALTYSGKGRKPKYCDEHRRSKGAATPTKRASGNERLAEQATTALCQINDMTGFGARLLGLPETAAAIDNANSGFRELAYNALLTDPALCRQIVSVGGASGKASLGIAYLMYFSAVGGAALPEIRARRAAASSDEIDAAG